MRWRYSRRCETEANTTLVKPVYGFRCENNELIIVPQEASIVREIFRLYLEGKTVQQIKISLDEKEVLSPSGKTTWADTTIRQIIKCENIKVMLCFKKTYIEDYLTGNRKVNCGQRQRCYVTGNHEGIIFPEVFHQVQDEMFRRARVVLNEDREQINTGNRYSSKYLSGNLLKCGNCAASYYRRTERGKIVWRCGTRMEKWKEVCGNSPT